MDPQPHHRRSIRLEGYDYSQAGVYFVTLVAQGRKPLFGTCANAEISLTPAGEMLRDQWTALASRFAKITLDEFVIMPNHFHGIILFKDEPVGAIPKDEPVGATLVVAPGGRAAIKAAPTNPTLGAVLAAYKSITTHEYILGVRLRYWPLFDKHLWQRNYYEHIIRKDTELARLREYIKDNPRRWAEDRENPFSR